MSNIIEIGDIGSGGMTKELFRGLLAQADPNEELVLKIDSLGGSVFDGLAMYDDLIAYQGPTRAVIQSAAFSMAAFVPMACDVIEITPNGYLMIHNPMTDTYGGDDADHASQADLLGKLKKSYARAICERTKKPQQEVFDLMAAETYFSAEEALGIGLVDRITEQKRPSAVASAEQSSLPHRVYAALRLDSVSQNEEGDSGMSETKSTAATISEIKAACPRASSDSILKWAERSLPLAQVTAEYTEEQVQALEELEKENEKLKAELEELKEAKAMEEEEQARAMEEEEKAKAEEEEEQARARASRPGVHAVANVSSTTGGKMTATAKWKGEINRLIESGQPKAKAVKIVNRQFPGLREQFLAEVNS
jgi:ATP-dependent Clp protease protease subunit